MLEVRSLCASRGAFELRGIDFCLGAGEGLGILGASGAGKSTLLDMIAGLEHPDEGSIEQGGWRVNDARSKIAPERRDCAYLMQDLGLWEHLSAERNVELVAHGPRGRGQSADILTRVGFAAQREASVSALSGGERQRVALARMLACSAGLVLLDEPGAHLDRAARCELAELVRADLGECGSSWIVAAHDLESLLRYEPRMLLLLAHGRVIGQGTTATLIDSPGRREAAELLGYNLFLPAERSSSSWTCALGTFSHRASWPVVDGACALAWRPGGIRIARDGPARARVLRVRLTDRGSGAMIGLEGGGSLMASGGDHAEPGSPVALEWDPPTLVVDRDGATGASVLVRTEGRPPTGESNSPWEES